MKKVFKLAPFILLITIVFLLSSKVFCQQYVFPDSNKRILKEQDLQNLSPWGLKVARNEIYARLGRKFQSKDLSCYFKSKNWYTVNPDYSDLLLNGFEKNNASFISNYEKKINSPVSSKDHGCNYSEYSSIRLSSSTNYSNTAKRSSSAYPFMGKSPEEIKRIFSSWELRTNYVEPNSIKFRNRYDLVIYFSNGKACGFSIYDLPGAYGVGIEQSDLNDMIKKFAGNSSVKKDIKREYGVIREADVGTIIW